jgi:Uma2 family endonuclease
MTLATDDLPGRSLSLGDSIAGPRRMSLDDYLNHRDDSGIRYELVQGELTPMTPPTWLHLRIARYLETIFNREIERLNLPWEAFREPGQQTEISSARVPDVAIVPSEFVDAMLDQSAVLKTASFLVVEIVSDSTATADYRDKVNEYATIGIREYWVVDPDPFGAAKYIGSPKLPTVSVYQLLDGTYEVQRYQGNQLIVSPTFPELELTAAIVLGAGK